MAGFVRFALDDGSEVLFESAEWSTPGTCSLPRMCCCA
jgi:hypothetical protein